MAPRFRGTHLLWGVPRACWYRMMRPPVPMNLYELYVANGMRLHFWVKRRTWGAMCARITSVDGLHATAIRAFGGAVRADIFYFSGGLMEADAVLPSPGSRRIWQRIPPLRLYEGADADGPVRRQDLRARQR